MTTSSLHPSSALSTTRETSRRATSGSSSLGADRVRSSARPRARARRLRRRAASTRSPARRCSLSARASSLLAVASSRFTNQPQTWALHPWRRIGRRRSRHLGSLTQRSHTRPRRLGLARAACCSRRSGRSAVLAASLHNWSRARAPLSGSASCSRSSPPAAPFETVIEATLLEPSRSAAHLSRQRPPPLPELRRLTARRRSSSSTASENARRAGRGCSATVSSSTRVCTYRPGRRGLERWQAAALRTAPAVVRPARPARCCACPRPLCARRALGRRHLRAPLRRALPRASRRSRLDRLGDPVSVRSSRTTPSFYSTVAARLGASSVARTCRSRARDLRQRVRHLCRRKHATPRGPSPPHPAS